MALPLFMGSGAEWSGRFRKISGGSMTLPYRYGAIVKRNENQCHCEPVLRLVWQSVLSNVTC